MSSFSRKIKKISQAWQKGGFEGVKKKIKYRLKEFFSPYFYQKPDAVYLQLTEHDRRELRREIDNFSLKPMISIVVPVYNVEERWLRSCIESVKKQLYPNWELCIADDNSPHPHVRRVLEEYAAQNDPRIKVVFRETNGHISAASNSALALATGEFTALLDHDDELAEDALFYVIKEINDFPAAELIYSDEDKIDENNTRHFSPALKPDWSPDLLYSLNLVTHLAVFRTETLRKINGFREGFEGSQDYDLVLRFYECISDEKIRHIPRILYHWRAIQGSIALGGEQKSYAHERARKAIKEHLERKGKKINVVEAVENLHRVVYELPADLPKVSVILCADENKNVAESLRNILAETDYPNFGILLGTSAGNEKKIEDVKRIVNEDNDRLKLIRLEKTETGFAGKLNEIARRTDDEILIFSEGNTAPAANADWLRELVSFARQKEIGAVGAKLLFPDETVRHAGIVLDSSDLIKYAHRDLPRENTGDFFRAGVVGNFPAVSGACLAIRREVFEELDGFDAENFPNGLHDVDLCLRLREKNYRVVFTPYAELIQAENSATEKLISVWKKGKTHFAETNVFRKKWREHFERK